MTDTTTYRKQGRALFLAAIMVISMVAAGAAFAAPAAATTLDTADRTLETDEVEPGETVEITVSGDLDGETEAIIYSDSFDPEFVDVSFESYTVDGEDTSLAEVDIDEFNNDGVDFIHDGGVGEESFELVYEVEVVDQDGSVHDIEDGDVTAVDPDDNENTVNFDDASISVEDDADPTDPADPVGDLEYTDVEGTGIDVVFQGQDVFLVGEVLDGAEGEDVNLRSVDNFDDGAVDSSSQVEQLQVEDGTDLDVNDAVLAGDGNAVEIETDDLDADDYFVRGAGDLPERPDEADTFEVTIQDLSVAFDDDEVTDSGPDSDTDLDIDSDRGSYSVNASADGDLDEEELLEVFVDQNVADGALVQLHLTDEIRERIVFSDADRVLVDGDNPTDIPEIDGQERFADLDDDQLEALIDAGLDELDADDPEAAGDLVDAINAEINDPDNELDRTADVFSALNPFNTFAFAEAEDDEDEKVVMGDIRDREEAVDFTDIDDDEYEFNFNVSDTEAADTDSITVREEDQDGDFSQGVYETGAGDVVEFTLELDDTDEALIQIGDENAGFADVILVEDDGGTDGEVTFQVNARTLGTPGLDDVDRAYHSEDDEVHSSAVIDGFGTFQSEVEDVAGYDGPIFVDDDGDAKTGESNEFTSYLEELDLIDSGEDADDQLTRPLQPASYDVTAGVNDGNDGYFEADDGESSAQNELDSALMELTVPDIGEIVTHVAPSDSADEDDELEDLLDVVTAREDVAIEDRLIVQVEATGLYGAMVDLSDDDFDVLEDGTVAEPLGTLTDIDGEGVEFTIEAQDAVGNQDPTEVDLSNDEEDEVFIILDNDEGQFFVIVDTDEDDAFSNGDPDDGDIFDATLEYDTDDDDRYEFFADGVFNGGADGDFEPAYPFLDADSDIEVTTSFTFADAEAEFDNLDEDGDLQVVADDDAEVSGETNVAPGTDASVRMRSTGDTSPSFVITEDTDIEGDGSFSATADLSAQSEGDTANTIFRADGDSIDSVSTVFVDTIEEDTPTPTPEEEDTPTPTPEEEDTPTPDEDTPTPDEETPTPDDTDDDTPGFGAVVALIALIAAALLATRRRTQG